MADESDGLLVEIGVTEKRMAQQLARLEAKAHGTATKVERSFHKSNAQISRGFAGLGKSQGLRQASLQLNQVAQQGAVTGNYIQALAIQMPDLLLAFGTFGALAGVAAGALIPFVANLAAGSKDAADLEKQLEKLNGALKDVRELTETYSVDGIEKLIEKYGELNDEIALLVSRQVSFAGNEATRAARAAVEAIRAEFEGGWLRGDIGTNENIAELLGVEASIVEIDELGNKFRGINPIVKDFKAALEAAATASDFDAMADALATLAGHMEGTKAETEGFFGTVVETEAQLRQASKAAKDLKTEMGGSVGAGEDFAGIDLASGVTAAADEAGRLFAILSQASALEYGKLQNTYGSGPDAARAEVMADRPSAPQAGGAGGVRKVVTPKKSRAGGRDTGLSDLQRFTDSMAADKRRLVEQIQLLDRQGRALVELSTKYDLLERARQAGIDLDTRLAETGRTVREEIDAQAAAVANYTEELQTAQARAEFFEETQRAVADAMIDAIVEGENLNDVLANLAKSLARAALQAALFGNGGPNGGGLLSGVFGFLGGGGGKLPGLAGGGPAAAGQPYLVNENTPRSEIFVPSRSGAILNVGQAQRALSGMGGGSMSVSMPVNIDARGAQIGVAEQIDFAIARRLPDLERRTVAAVRSAASRGKL